MQTFKAWLQAARLRTLPLSLSGILVGTALANHYGYHNTGIFIWALLTTVSLQITSNFANDYGDGVKGTDNDDRIGPARAFQSGLLSRGVLKRGIQISVGINFLLIAILLWLAFKDENPFYIILFTLLGIASVWAAIKYTVGSNAYGYSGFGDLFVFCFFGLLAVLGSFFLYTKFITVTALLPAAAIGCLSTAVLNLNNMRDIDSDERAGKRTLAVKLGSTKSKRYHYVLIGAALFLTLTFVVLEYQRPVNFLCLLAFLPIIYHLYVIYSIKDKAKYDPELKKLALSTFLLALLFYIGFNNFL